MFKLKDLSTNFYAIVKDDDVLEEGKPIVTYGFLNVIDCDDGTVLESEIAEGSIESIDLDFLIMQAIERTREHILEETED